MKFNRLSQQHLSGKRVFIRADLNVPQDETGTITDDSRIRASLPAIIDAQKVGAKVMVTSHLGRPTEGHPRQIESLAPIARRMGELLGREIRLIENWLQQPFAIADGEVVLLENCRFNVGEKANENALARKMAALCDIYVNDAFGTAHRAEATTEGIAKYAPIACAGPLMAAELEALTKALAAPKRPLVAVVAGSKVSTKLTILEALADKVDLLVVGGGIANTFLLAKGYNIGKSLAEASLVNEANRIMGKMAARGATVPLPTDVVCAKAFSADAVATTKPISEVLADDKILDIGYDSAAALYLLMQKAGTIVWNGPVGVFEFEAFSHGTRLLGRGIADSKAYSIAGGGDTISAINMFGLTKDVDYISTAGGAFLEFLEGKTLPAVAALEARA